MIYVINSKDLIYSLEKINQSLNSDANIKKINYQDDSQLIADFSQINLFEHYDAYYIFDCPWFESTKDFKNAQTSIDYLNEHLNDLNLYFFYIDKRIDESLINQKYKNIKFIKINPITNLSKIKIIKDLLKDYKINLNDNLIDYLSLNSANSYAIIKHEIDKLYAYQKSNDSINTEIYNLISNYQDANIFKLVDYILNKNKDQALNLFHLINLNELDEILIINSLSSYLVNIYYVINYSLNHSLTSSEINKLTGLNNYAINDYVTKFNNKKNFKQIKQMINDLYRLEVQIKQFNLDKKVLLTSLIINWLNA